MDGSCEWNQSLHSQVKFFSLVFRAVPNALGGVDKMIDA